MPEETSTGENPTQATWLGQKPVSWLLIFICVVAASPVVAPVRQSAEAKLGWWGAFGLGVLVASAVGLVVLVVAAWVLRRERLGQPGDQAAMVYRPAIFPVWVYIGAFMNNLPEALTEWLAYLYLAWLAAVLGGAFLLQRRRGQAWSWWVAIPVGMGIALVALLGAVVTTAAITGVPPR